MLDDVWNSLFRRVCQPARRRISIIYYFDLLLLLLLESRESRERGEICNYTYCSRGLKPASAIASAIVVSFGINCSVIRFGTGRGAGERNKEVGVIELEEGSVCSVTSVTVGRTCGGIWGPRSWACVLSWSSGWVWEGIEGFVTPVCCVGNLYWCIWSWSCCARWCWYICCCSCCMTFVRRCVWGS